MRVAEVEVGMRVVVSREPDATVYVVKEVIPNFFAAELVYKRGDGRIVSGGTVDTSVLMRTKREA